MKQFEKFVEEMVTPRKISVNDLEQIKVGLSLRINNFEKILEKEPSQVTFHRPGKKFDPKTDLMVRPSQNLLKTPCLKKKGIISF